MYGNYPHFVKFPTGFGGECCSVGSVWGDGETGRRGAPARVESGVCACTHGMCFRVCACTCVCIRRGWGARPAMGEALPTRRDEWTGDGVWGTLRSVSKPTRVRMRLRQS